MFNLSIADIKSRYDSEWILLDAPETNGQLEIERGAVLAHSPNRDDVYRAAVELRPERFAILYTGRARANTEIVLYA